MTDQDLASAIKAIEAQMHTFDVDAPGISYLFRQLLEQHAAALTPEQLQWLEWEERLFGLVTSNRFKTGGLKTDRFRPGGKTPDGRRLPDPDGFPPEAIAYFERRSVEATSPIAQARYLDFLWEKSMLPKKHLLAQQAVDVYLAAYDSYQGNLAIFEKLDALQRAADLALTLEVKQALQPRCQTVAAKIASLIGARAADGDYRALLELFELVGPLSRFFQPDDIRHYLDLCNLTMSHSAFA